MNGTVQDRIYGSPMRFLSIEVRAAVEKKKYLQTTKCLECVTVLWTVRVVKEPSSGCPSPHSVDSVFGFFSLT